MSTSPRRLAITGQFQLVISLVFIMIGGLVLHDYLLRLIVVMVGFVNLALGIFTLIRAVRMLRGAPRK